MGRPRQTQRFVIVVNWQPDVIGGDVDVFGTWRSHEAAQDQLDKWLPEIKETEALGCAPAASVQELHNSEPDTLTRRVRAARSRRYAVIRNL